jgi:hypothetical protein
VRREEGRGKKKRTYVHLEDPTDTVDGHPYEVLAVVVCAQSTVSLVAKRKAERKDKKRTALVKHLNQGP